MLHFISQLLSSKDKMLASVIILLLINNLVAGDEILDLSNLAGSNKTVLDQAIDDANKCKAVVTKIRICLVRFNDSNFL